MKCTTSFTNLLPLLPLLPLTPIFFFFFSSHVDSFFSFSHADSFFSFSSSQVYLSFIVFLLCPFSLFCSCTFFCFVYLTLSHMKSSFISSHLREQKMCKQVLLFNFFFAFNELKSTIYQAKQLTFIIRFSIFRQIVDKCTYYQCLGFNILQKLF